MSVVAKALALFKQAPWLEMSKNVVHIKIHGMEVDDGLT